MLNYAQLNRRLVSIHAPVRVRLPEHLPLSHSPNVSIHAPVRVRLQAVVAALVGLAVSIHAPVRVRPGELVSLCAMPGFNPRTREGATMEISPTRILCRVSIHAPVRVRRLRVKKEPFEALFQSTHP